jgi:autotransporter passenger strand-loop-strand repeat protein
MAIILGLGSPYTLALVEGTETYLFTTSGTIIPLFTNEVFNVTVNYGGELIEYGGTAVDTIVNNGGFEEVNAGGFSTFATINAGGTEYVLLGGVEEDATVRARAVALVYAGGETFGDSLVGHSMFTGQRTTQRSTATNV